MRTLFLTIVLCVSFAACGDDKKGGEAKPDEAPAETAEPAPKKTGQVKRMAPSQVKKEVDRAGKEYTDKVDKSLDY